MTAVTVFTILLMICASALCVALVIYIGRITKSIREIEIDIKDISLQIKPLIASTTNLSEKLNKLSEDAKQPISTVKDIADDIKNRVDTVLAFEEKLREGIQEPATRLIRSLSAIANGVNAFWNAYRRR
jgi:uncharacterized protein YoxC